MISFRYHVVTIVAVLIALAVGILLGGTFVDVGQALQLKKQVDSLGTSRSNLRSLVSELRTENVTLTDFANAWFPSIVRDRLAGVPVVLVTVQGVDLQTVSAARQALQDAGVTELETIQIFGTMGSTDPADRAALAEAIGLSSATPTADVDTLAASALADRLLQAPPSGAPDVLLALQTAKFLRIVGQPSASSIGVPGQTVLVIDGGKGTPAVQPSLFLIPLLNALVDRDSPAAVVAGEPAQTDYAFVPLIRSSDLDRRLVTVDDLDTVFGQLSAVIGLQDLVATPGKGADYGVDRGASAPFPSP
jgi:hypothetical protein